ncbi:hypothetical protein [Psychromonas sp. Urea-02u-13]|uniref:hypothetical protein n=1 Tax=Psychromonas sp. Urea-02u-13 TaxID=2058326 RepID=UPI0012FEF887|nr:hypothetical protein [Psychromonas sp. Urea-02u-13]
MNHFKLAVAQVASIKGDIDANIKTHLKALIKASELNVNYLYPCHLKMRCQAQAR